MTTAERISDEAKNGMGISIVYQQKFPLRGDVTVVLWLPRDLTELEAERLSMFIKALVMPLSKVGLGGE